MRFIEIDLDGSVVRAKLNEDKAPKTSNAVWEALPFEGRAVHAQLSGDMFRMLDPTPIEDLEVENGEVHQYPGSVVYYPPLKEIAFCYGVAQFRGPAGAVYLTPLADIEGDFSEWADKADALPITGARSITFRQAADQETPFRYPKYEGQKVEVEFDDITLKATLLEDLAPTTTAAFANALPLEGKGINDDWGGPLTRFLGEDEARAEIDLGISEAESGKSQIWPGYIYYDATRHRVYVCYGDASLGDITETLPATPIAVLDGDWEPYRLRAAKQLTEGAKNMAFRMTP